MVRKLLLLIFPLIATGLSAQLVVSQDSVYEEHFVSSEDIVVHNIQSTPSPTLDVKWEVVSVDVPSTWENDFFVCDATQCYDSTTNENDYTLPDNKQYPLDVHFLNNNEVGEGIAKIRIWEVADSANTSKIITFHAKVSQDVAVADIEDIAVQIYPNPTTDYVIIKNDFNHDIVAVEVYNIIGKKVKSVQLTSNNQQISFKEFDSGVYIVRLLDSNSNYYSQNIIKTK